MMKIKQVLIIFALALFALPVHALDVSVVDGRAQAGGTLSALQARVNLLLDAVSVTSTQLTQTIQELNETQVSLTIAENDIDLMEACNQNGEIYDRITQACIPANAEAVFDQFNCADGDILILEAGTPVCKKRMAGCQVCSTYSGTVNRIRGTWTYFPDFCGKACQDAGGTSNPYYSCVTTLNDIVALGVQENCTAVQVGNSIPLAVPPSNPPQDWQNDYNCDGANCQYCDSNDYTITTLDDIMTCN
jgi:hypothetical protein